MSGDGESDRSEDRRSGDASVRWDDLLPESSERGVTPVFLDRKIYRRRRVMDAARLLPAFGTALLMLPMLWAQDYGTAAGAIYLFLIWILLIVTTALIARRLAEPLRDERKEGPSAGPSGAGQTVQQDREG